jgi:cyclopropane fatty-acyl-phospholipid synthase-like methyltransferase
VATDDSSKNDPKRIVREGYDAVSRAYVDDAGIDRAEQRRRWLAPLMTALPHGATVVDLGCGAGVPATRMLAERFRVIGVDISPVQIERARPECQFRPGGHDRGGLRAGFD